jgi:hypothetical protein
MPMATGLTDSAPGLRDFAQFCVISITMAV